MTAGRSYPLSQFSSGSESFFNFMLEIRRLYVEDRYMSVLREQSVASCPGVKEPQITAAYCTE